MDRRNLPYRLRERQVNLSRTKARPGGIEWEAGCTSGATSVLAVLVNVGFQDGPVRLEAFEIPERPLTAFTIKQRNLACLC
jgi:hypothetical protein